MNKKGLTLVEVLISVSIFSILFGSLMVGQHFSRNKAELGLINYVILQHSQGLIEAIQSYKYEDTSYQHGDLQSNSSTAFNKHSVTFGAFDSSSSGIYNGGTLKESLQEESISLKHKVSTIPSDATPLNPFAFGSLSPNKYLLGPEIDNKDSGSDPATGFFKINEADAKLNVFGEGQEKYFFMDDVDDFDGYRESIEILPGLTVVFEVAVTAVYGNRQNHAFSIKNLDGSVAGNGVINQDRFAPLPPISIESIQTLVPTLLSSDDAASQTQQLAYDYYSCAVMKKITVKATWVYPIGSNNTKTLVIDGGKVNPLGSVL